MAAAAGDANDGRLACARSSMRPRWAWNTTWVSPATQSYGLVQIPCIERNAFAANKALTCADYALFTDGVHRIAFDVVVAVMLETGNDLPSPYRETSSGGLATMYRRYKKNAGAM